MPAKKRGAVFLDPLPLGVGLMRKGPREIPRIEQLAASLPDDLIRILRNWQAERESSEEELRRLAYIKQVFDLCEVPVSYKPGDMGRMAWGDFLEGLVERFGGEHLCPQCGYLMDVPAYQYGDMVCLRSECRYVKKGAEASGCDVDDCGV